VLNAGTGQLTASAAQMEAFETIQVSAADTTGAVSLRLSAAGFINLAGELGARAVTFTGSSGDDDITTGDGGDIIDGDAGSDILKGRAGDDLILQGAGDGRDIIDGGGGLDTYRLTGAAAAETFRVYTRAEALAAGMTGLAAGTEIVITRDGTENASIIAELDNIEEIEINALVSTADNANGVVDGGLSDGDTIIVIGDFSSTSLHYSTIRIAGSGGDDTVDISGLTSAHRVVFTSNGGSDAVVGEPRAQDVFEGMGAAPPPYSFGLSDGLDRLIRSAMREELASAGYHVGQHGIRADRGSLADLMFNSACEGLFASGTIDMHRAPVELNVADHAPASAYIDHGDFDHRLGASHYDILPA
jgi:hypothetical protein